MVQEISKSQEILGNQDSANPWILSESVKIRNLAHHFFTLRTPRISLSLSLFHTLFWILHMIFTSNLIE